MTFVDKQIHIIFTHAMVISHQSWADWHTHKKKPAFSAAKLQETFIYF